MFRHLLMLLMMLVLGVLTGCQKAERPDASTIRPVPTAINEALPLEGKLGVGSDEKTVFLSTKDGTRLPPLTPGKDFKLLVPGAGQDDYTEVSASDYKNFAGRNVSIQFRDEGQNRVVDKVTILKDR